MAAGDVRGALAGGDTGSLSDEVLARWVLTQRWFAAKSREVHEFNVLDVLTLSAPSPLLAVVIAEARFRAGTHELYQVPLAVRPDGDGWERGVICHSGADIVYDALTDPAQTAVLVGHLSDSDAIESPYGRVSFHWDPAVEPPDPQPRMRGVEAEQSNTSVVFDDRLVLKVFRRLEPGINPELEMLRFLSAHDFRHSASLAGWYEYAGQLMEATLGVMQHLITPAQDGWDLALAGLSAADGGLLERLRELGEVTGRMHAALACDPGDPDFAPEEPTDETVSLLSATIDEQIERVFLDLPDDPALAPIAGRGEEVRDHLRMLSHTGIGGRLIRHHGDYHLGQTVLGPDGWVILDFEGEPGRPLLERRRKRSPLRDVAGMLRSFAYVASAAERLRGVPAPAGWEAAARERFLEGYMTTIDPGLLPAGAVAVHRLLAIFELEKAVYELRYELDNRPQWVGVPVAGIARWLEQSSA